MQAHFPVWFCWRERMMRSMTPVPSVSVSVAVLNPEAEKEQLNFIKSVSTAAGLIGWWFDRQVESCWGRTLIGQTLSAFACLQISSAHFLHVRDAFCLAGPLIPPRPPRTRWRFSSLEFSPFRLEARLHLEPRRKPFSSVKESAVADAGAECPRTGTGDFNHFPHIIWRLWGRAGAMLVFSALWALLLCQLLTSTFAQVRFAHSRFWWWWHLSARIAGHTK